MRIAAGLTPGTAEDDPKPFSEWIELGSLGVPPPAGTSLDARSPFAGPLCPAPPLGPPPLGLPPPGPPLLGPPPPGPPPVAPPPWLEEPERRLPAGNTGAASRRPVSRGIW